MPSEPPRSRTLAIFTGDSPATSIAPPRECARFLVGVEARQFGIRVRTLLAGCSRSRWVWRTSFAAAAATRAALAGPRPPNRRSSRESHAAITMPMCDSKHTLGAKNYGERHVPHAHPDIGAQGGTKCTPRVRIPCTMEGSRRVFRCVSPSLVPLPPASPTRGERPGRILGGAGRDLPKPARPSDVARVASGECAPLRGARGGRACALRSVRPGGRWGEASSRRWAGSLNNPGTQAQTTTRRRGTGIK